MSRSKRSIPRRVCPYCASLPYEAASVPLRAACTTCAGVGYIDAPVCRCCGAEGATGLCAPCREAHGAESKRHFYIASLSCEIREEREAVDAELSELFEPGSTVAPFEGHSEECWTTTPMHLTPEIHARCPKCSAPPDATAVIVEAEKRAATRAQYESTAGMDMSVGYRSGQRRARRSART